MNLIENIIFCRFVFIESIFNAIRYFCLLIKIARDVSKCIYIIKNEKLIFKYIYITNYNICVMNDVEIVE